LLEICIRSRVVNGLQNKAMATSDHAKPFHFEGCP